MNLRPVLRILGRLLLILALAEALPALCGMVYGEREDALAFLLASLTTAAVGGLFALLGRGGGELFRREGILIVVGGWALASLFGALPYLWTDTLASPVDALFESASGFTTTGASVLTDIEGQGRAVLFWRSFTQWLGGMGIIVLFVALLPEIVPGARFLFKLEVPGPTAEALHPRVRDTAIVLWQIYLSFTLAETVALMAAGLDLYDALTHTFSTLSTGGFSPYNASVAAFASPWVESIVIVFMVLAGINFSLFYALRRGAGRLLLRDPELRVYLLLIGVVAAVIASDLLASGTYRQPGRAVLDALFQVASLLTTTGFATADFDTWPLLSRMLLVSAMFVGGCAGSTAGSMKVSRMLIGLKFALREVRLVFSPNLVRGVFLGGKPVPESVVRSVSGFFILFMTSWGVGALLLAIGGQGMLTAATASIATLGNIGPGLEAVGPIRNYAHFDALQKLLMVFLMWLGRLEVYAIAAVVTFGFWRK
ncbi:MAG TPA: TrkH family potassium uptake protein [Thermoanaerobaculia bacterium]|nr:TrkH family potassium uptake protein [Thermoanaerobaculia bacterium]